MNLFKRKKVKKQKGLTAEQLAAADKFGEKVRSFINSTPRPIGLVGEEAQELMEKNLEDNFLTPQSKSWAGGYSYKKDDYKNSAPAIDSHAMRSGTGEDAWKDGNWVESSKSEWKNSNSVDSVDRIQNMEKDLANLKGEIIQIKSLLKELVNSITNFTG
tara:strand:- start:41 stop:517 length:477 start_codon:yes stop_codon:yes gene_type:complete